MICIMDYLYLRNFAPSVTLLHIAADKAVKVILLREKPFHESPGHWYNTYLRDL